MAQDLLRSPPMVLGVMACATLSVSGCILPLDLSVGGFDAGRGSPPIITDQVSPEEFLFSGPITVERDDPRFITLTLSDNDLEDILFVRMFVDYRVGDATPIRSECAASPSGAFERQVSCSARQLCNPIAQTDTSAHALEAVVADRDFLPLGPQEPAFKAIPEGANSTTRTWLMVCNDAQQ